MTQKLSNQVNDFKMTNTLAIIGSGNIGKAVARLAVKAGFNITIANSRGPETLKELVEELGSNARAATVEEAVDTNDIVVVSIPFFRYRQLPAAVFSGKIVIDTMNYDPNRDTAVKELIGKGRTPSELLQAYLTNSRVVKAFSNIFANHIELLARPDGAEDRSALPIAGDDDGAKNQVASIMARLGWDTVDTGILASSKLFDLGQPAFVVPYLTDSSGDWVGRLSADNGKTVSKQTLGKILELD